MSLKLNMSIFLLGVYILAEMKDSGNMNDATNGSIQLVLSCYLVLHVVLLSIFILAKT